MKKKIHDASLMTAIKTPYKSGGEIDLDCYDELVTEQMRNGVEGLIVCGTTGEGHLMDWEEHLMLIAHSVNRFGDEVDTVGDEHQVFLPIHQMAFPGGSADNQPFHPLSLIHI